jgi:23S rRNA (uracil1939-C5)-methyltransferase
MNRYPVKRGDTVPLQIERLAFGGKGVARMEGYTLFVEHGIPGQEVLATVVRRKKTYGEARIERVVSPSSLEVAPRCSDFGVCGGCALQHLGYQAQLEAKREQVRDCLRRIGGLSDIEVLPTHPSPDQYEYRNKMEYSFSTRWLTLEEVASEEEPERFGLGLHVRRRFNRVVNVSRCHLQSEAASEILALARELSLSSGFPAYSTKTHRGFWRFLVIREGVNTGNRMVHLVTNRVPPGSPEWNEVESVGRALWSRGLHITSLLHGMTESKASVAVCENVRTLAGEMVIRERLMDLTFEIEPNAFFQTNTRGAERLFTEALELGSFSPEDTVWDLYCGVGGFTLPLARRVRSVVGAEIAPLAVAAAERNARANNIDNVEFVAGDVRTALSEMGSRSRPDVVVVDPPRDGVHPDVIRTILDAGPSRIVYISCNPATLARDLELLVRGGYCPGPVRPVDLFPHTPHVECVTAMSRETSP